MLRKFSQSRSWLYARVIWEHIFCPRFIPLTCFDHSHRHTGEGPSIFQSSYARKFSYMRIPFRISLENVFSTFFKKIMMKNRKECEFFPTFRKLCGESFFSTKTELYVKYSWFLYEKNHHGKIFCSKNKQKKNRIRRAAHCFYQRTLFQHSAMLLVSPIKLQQNSVGADFQADIRPFRFSTTETDRRGFKSQL